MKKGSKKLSGKADCLLQAESSLLWHTLNPAWGLVVTAEPFVTVQHAAMRAQDLRTSLNFIWGPKHGLAFRSAKHLAAFTWKNRSCT